MTHHQTTEEAARERSLILHYIQPGLVGLMDGSVSTLAPIFASAFATHNTHTAFVIGLAASIGAGISMAFSEALSDDGSITGRGNPWLRGIVTGIMTTVGGTGHTLPFLMPNVSSALTVAYCVVGIELMSIAFIRHRYFKMSFVMSVIQVIFGGALVFASGVMIGSS